MSRSGRMPSGSPVARSRVNSTPIISPSPRMSPIRSSSAAILPRPVTSSAPRARALATRSSSRIVSRTARPAAQATGLPPYVEPCAPRPQRSWSVAARDDRRERQAVGDRLGHAHDVGHDPRVLERPHRAGPAVARLDLVGDEQDAVLVADARGARAGTRPAPGCSRPRRGPARSGSRATCDGATTDVEQRLAGWPGRPPTPPPRRRRTPDRRSGRARSRRPAAAARSPSGS